MIKTEKEYIEAKKRLSDEFKELENHKIKMKKSGMTDSQIKLAIDPLASFALQLQDEVDEYEKIQRGQFEPIFNMENIGRTLVAIRIFKGMKQKDLASKLSVSEAQVSRDERNEYHGASLEKIQKVLTALDVVIKSEVEVSFPEELIA